MYSHDFPSRLLRPNPARIMLQFMLLPPLRILRRSTSIGIKRRLLNATATSLIEAGHNVTFLHSPVVPAGVNLKPYKDRKYFLYLQFETNENRNYLQDLLDRFLWQDYIVNFHETYKTMITSAHIPTS